MKKLLLLLVAAACGALAMPQTAKVLIAERVKGLSFAIENSQEASLTSRLSEQLTTAQPAYSQRLADVDAYSPITRTVAVVEFVGRIGPYLRATEEGGFSGMIDEFRVLDSLEPEPARLFVLTSNPTARDRTSFEIPRTGIRYLLIASKPQADRLPYASVNPRIGFSVPAEDVRERWGFGLFETRQTRIIVGKDPAFTAIENVFRTLYDGSRTQTRDVSELIWQFANHEAGRQHTPPWGVERKPRRDREVLERLALEFAPSARVTFYGALSRKRLDGYGERFYQSLFALAQRLVWLSSWKLARMEMRGFPGMK